MSKFHTNLKVSQKIHSLGVKAARAAARAATAEMKTKIIEYGISLIENNKK